MRKANAAKKFEFDLPGEELLAKRLAYSLTFAKNTLKHLIIDGHPASEEAPWFVKNEKIIAETAFLIAFSKNNRSHPEVDKAFIELIEVVEPLARSKAMLTNICLKPGLALDYGQAHVCLDYAGYPNSRFDDALHAALKSSAASCVERTPYRMMEGEWLKQLWNKGIEDNMSFWTQLSCLNHAADFFSENSDGAYSITHAVMYGAFRRKEITGIDPEKLFQTIESLLIRYMDEQNYDVAGELLMTWPLLNRKWSHTALFALHCLFKIEERVGFLPAPGLERSRIDGAEQDEKRTYIYSINYHTALVMGLLCNTLLENRGCIETSSNGRSYSGKWSSIVENEISTGKEVHWKEYYQGTSDIQKQKLLPMLYQVCLIRWVREKKYGSVKKLLDNNEEALLHLPISNQAKELLLRLQILADGLS